MMFYNMRNHNRAIINLSLFGICLLILLPALLLHYRIVSGRSMEPTLREGQRILFSPWVYGLPRPFHSGFLFTWGKVKQGDILIYNSPLENRIAVKRCVAAPGDRVEYKRGIFSVNGNPLPPSPEPPAGVFQNGRLPSDMFFCMGDNPEESVDSRIYGPVPLDYLIGRVILSSS